MTDIKTYIDESQEKRDMAISILDEALAHIRAEKRTHVSWTAYGLIITEASFPSVM